MELPQVRGYGSACFVIAFLRQSASPKIIVEHQRDGDHDRDDRDHEMVPLEARKRRARPVHCARSLAASRFSMVVFASHSLPGGRLVLCFATNRRGLKKPGALSLPSAVSRPAPRAAAIFSSASMSMLPPPCPPARE